MAIYSGFTYKQWWFSIVMLVYQRVILSLSWLLCVIRHGQCMWTSGQRIMWRSWSRIDVRGIEKLYVTLIIMRWGNPIRSSFASHCLYKVGPSSLGKSVYKLQELGILIYLWIYHYLSLVWVINQRTSRLGAPCSY